MTAATWIVFGGHMLQVGTIVWITLSMAYGEWSAGGQV